MVFYCALFLFKGVGKTVQTTEYFSDQYFDLQHEPVERLQKKIHI